MVGLTIVVCFSTKTCISFVGLSWVHTCLTVLSCIFGGLWVSLLTQGWGPHRSSKARLLWTHVSGGGEHGALTLGGGGMFKSSLNSSLNVDEFFFGVSLFDVTVGEVPCGGRLGLHVEKSGCTGSGVPDDREVREEEGEAAEDEARDTDLSGLTGFFCFSGEVGEIPLGGSVGVPLWLEYPLEGDMVRSNFSPSEGAFCGEELLDSDCGSGGPSVSMEEACVGLRGLEETSGELDPIEFGIGVGILLVFPVTNSISSFTRVFSVAVSTCPDTESLRSLLSTRNLELLLIVLLWREFVLCGGAGGCFVFITERLRVELRLFFASSPAVTEHDMPDSDP